MSKVSILIPSRNEQFLPQTIEDIFAKATGSVEVIVHLDGAWPDPPLVNRPNLHIIHRTKPVGLRRGLNSCVEVATGDYVMKVDAHCMFSEGFDEVLQADCEPNWVCVPTRHRLDPEAWQINNGGRPPINYLYLDASNDGINVKEWRAKNRDRSLDVLEIDDILTCQGSVYFLPRAYWHELELLDEENYGPFRKDPQEVCFKAWCSGGRVIRNKKCWYAHLHKGSRYGRGYRISRSGWAKGDEYVKEWWTDSAWDKQTKPFRWLIEKFGDMPGWENHEWTYESNLSLPNPEQAPVDTQSLPNLYQYLEVDGKPFSRPKPDRAGSRFWNEGKWETFIAPLLPDNCGGQTFVEMGCDAGLFLKLATDRGFQRVVGIEKNSTPTREGLRYRDAIGYNYSLLKRTLGGKFHEHGTFDISELPVADITLMSTFHYYIDINAWLKYLDRLAARSCYVLIVSRPDLDNGHWLAQADYEAVSKYFQDWREIGKIENVSQEGDPKPRDLYSVIFQSPLIRRVAIDDIDVRESATDPMFLAMMDLAKQIVANDAIDPFTTDYYQRWQERKGGQWSERTTRRFVQLKVDIMQGVKADDLKDPLIVEQGSLRLCDGGHRLAMLKALGHKSVIVRGV